MVPVAKYKFEISLVLLNLVLFTMYMSQRQVSKNFVKDNCEKRDKCTHDGESVCGYDRRHKITAEFYDMCVFYTVNCFKQGHFRLLKTNNCKANTTFHFKQITAHDGKTLPYVMTRIPKKSTTSGKMSLVPKSDVKPLRKSRVTRSVDKKPYSYIKESRKKT